MTAPESAIITKLIKKEIKYIFMVSFLKQNKRLILFYLYWLKIIIPFKLEGVFRNYFMNKITVILKVDNLGFENLFA